MSTTRVFIYDQDGNDISDEIELKDGRGNPFGWSQHQIYWTRNVMGAELSERIGSVDSGDFIFEKGFTHKEVKED